MTASDRIELGGGSENLFTQYHSMRATKRSTVEAQRKKQGRPPLSDRAMSRILNQDELLPLLARKSRGSDHLSPNILPHESFDVADVDGSKPTAEEAEVEVMARLANIKGRYQPDESAT